MKIIRFFLSNFILITFFCAIIYAYYFWDNLTGEDTPAGQAIAYLSKEFKGVGNFIDGIKIKQGHEDDDVADDTAASVVVDNSIDENVSMNDEEQIVVSKVKEDVFVTPEIERSLNQALNRQASKQAAVPTIVAISQDDKDPNKAIWIDARKAFYKRDYASSISSYRQVIANSTNNYDAYGELGNVYFNQGKKTEAAAAYYEAASLLVKSGHARRADSLLPLLNYLDTDKAVQLKELLVSNQPR